MIGLHISPDEIYTDNHENAIFKVLNYNVVISYHKQYSKQVYFQNDTHLVICDGWIFNAPCYERQCEYILDKYIQEKEKLYNHLNGQFNIFIYDKKEGCFLIINDIFSFRKHYYSIEKERFCFSSDFSFVYKHLKDKAINTSHLNKNLNSNRLYYIEQSFITNIKLLSRHEYIESNTLKAFKYSLDDIHEKYSINFINSPKEFNEQLRRNIQKVHREENILIELSGGLDCRYLLELLSEIGHNHLTTLSYGIIYGDEMNCANRVAYFNKTNHVECHLEPSDYIEHASLFMKESAGLDIFVQSAVKKVFEKVADQIPTSAVLDTGFALDAFLGGTQAPLQFDVKSTHITNEEFDLSDNDIFSSDYRVFSCIALREFVHREFVEDRYSIFSYENWYLMMSIPQDLIKDYQFYIPLLKDQVKNSYMVPYQATMFGLDLEYKHWAKAKDIASKKEFFTREVFLTEKTEVYHNRYYSDFDAWIRRDENWQRYVVDRLKNRNSMIYSFVDYDVVNKSIEEHLLGEKNNLRLLIKLCSLEVFFEQYNIRYNA